MAILDSRRAEDSNQGSQCEKDQLSGQHSKEAPLHTGRLRVGLPEERGQIVVLQYVD
jgi:hypothetical protein